MFKSLFWLIVTLSLVAVGCADGLNDNQRDSYDFNACDAGFVFENGVCNKSNEIKDNTIVVTTGEIDNLLKNYEMDMLEFVNTDRTSSFKEGDIVAFQESDKFKNGYIAKIISVENESDSIVLHTEIISPLLAFKNLKLDIKKIATADPNSELFKNPTLEQINKFRDVHHIYQPQKEASKELPFTYNKEYAKGTLEVTGKVTFSDLVEIYVDIREDDGSGVIIDDYYLDELTIKNTFGLDAEAHITANYPVLEPNLKRFNKRLFRKTFNLVNAPVIVSGIKFNIKLTLTARADVKASLQGTAKIDLTSTNRAMVGLSYKKPKGRRSTTELLKSFNSSNTLHTEVSLEGNAGVSLTLTPSVVIYAVSDKLFNVQGKVAATFTPLYVESKMNASTDLDDSGNLSNKAKACFTADAILNLTPSVELNAIKFPGKDPLIHKTLNLGEWEKKWSWLEGVGESVEKCVQLSCATDAECQVSKKTADATCEGGKCVYKPKSSSYRMISIAGGSFQRGCISGDDECVGTYNTVEKPVKSVTLRAYKIGEKEVTNAQYKACVTAGKCKAPINSTTYENSPNKPITNISWESATRYCAWVGGYRLPTEAEWENAAKDGSNKKFPWGDDLPTCKETMMSGLRYLDSSGKATPDPNGYTSCTPPSDGCFSCHDGDEGCGSNGYRKANNALNPKYGAGCSTGKPANVGSYAKDKTSKGVYDMAGNVSEWVSDYYSSRYYKSSSSTNNPNGPTVISNGLVSVRGGNYLHNGVHKDSNDKYVNGGGSFRSSNRNSRAYTVGAPDIGFRCAAFQ